MQINLKNLPTIPLVIGGVVTLMGCILLLGIAYALIVPSSSHVAQAGATATRKFVTATPISTATPTPTDTPSPTSTDQPTSTPSSTPTHPPVTRVPSTAVPPTNTPVPPTPVLGAELGLDGIGFNLSIRTQGKGLEIPLFVKVHNANNFQVPFGYLGVGVHDSTGTSVAFRKLKINSYLDANEYYSAHDAIKVYKIGEMDAFFVICISSNDYACDQPGADYHQLAGPIHLTITG